jgi:hypothetical protein
MFWSRDASPVFIILLRLGVCRNLSLPKAEPFPAAKEIYL